MELLKFLCVAFYCGSGFLVLACNDPKYAKYDKHTMCLQPKACAGKTLSKTSTLDAYERMAVLDIHNRLRHLVATAQIIGQPGAKHMKQLIWDEELATVAQRWAEQCEFEHDTQRSVDRFPVGQNLAIEWRSPPPFADKSAQVISSSVMMFNEVHDPGFPPSQIKPFVSKKGVGHYTQMVWANTSMIGCGFSIYTENIPNNPRGKESKFLVCNFGPSGNWISGTMYEVGAPACEVFSKQYAGLCTTDEINKSFKPPCNEKEFKKRYSLLCDEDEFIEKSGVKGIYIGMSAWKIVLSVLAIIAALFIAGFIVNKLDKNGRLTGTHEIHFPKVNFSRLWKG